MKLKKILTILIAIYGVFLLGFLVINSQLLFIEDATVYVNIIVFNLVFIVMLFILGLVMTSNLEKIINRQNKTINDLKGRLYDSIKDEEEKEKMLKDFEKSLK